MFVTANKLQIIGLSVYFDEPRSIWSTHNREKQTRPQFLRVRLVMILHQTFEFWLANSGAE